MTDSYHEFPWHDQAPSHPPVPPAIADMEVKLADRIARADTLVERYLKDYTGAVTWADIEKVTEDVVLCQNALYYLRDVEHGNDCTCSQDVNAVSECRFCYLKHRYDQFMMEQCSKGE